MQGTICRLECNEAKVKLHWELRYTPLPVSNSAQGPWRDFCQRLSQHCLSRWCVHHAGVRLCSSVNSVHLSWPRITTQCLIKYVLIDEKMFGTKWLNSQVQSFNLFSPWYFYQVLVLMQHHNQAFPVLHIDDWQKILHPLGDSDLI